MQQCGGLVAEAVQETRLAASAEAVAEGTSAEAEDATALAGGGEERAQRGDADSTSSNRGLNRAAGSATLSSGRGMPRLSARGSRTGRCCSAEIQSWRRRPPRCATRCSGAA